MHFPGGVDVELSDSSRLLSPGSPVSSPYFDTRIYDGRSLESDSPTVIIHVATGRRVLHFVDLDFPATLPAMVSSRGCSMLQLFQSSMHVNFR
jgi:hypothetical protein